MELSRLAHTLGELVAYKPEYAHEYNELTASILRGYNSKKMVGAKSDREYRPRLCYFNPSAESMKYYKPIIRYINPCLVDIVIKNRKPTDAQTLKDYGMADYNVVYGVNNIKNYDYVIVQELNAAPKHIDNIDARLILLCHTIEHSITEYYINRAALFIYELELESGNEPTLNPALFDAENRRLYNSLPVDARCEVTHTGMYHIDEFMPDPEFRRIYRRRLVERYGYRLEEDKPLVVFMEDSTSHFGQMIYCLNRLCEVANVIFKPAGSLNRTLMDRLSSKIIVHKGKNWVHNDLRYSADFIMAGYRSGSLMSSLLLGIPVIPYYSRIEFHNNIGTGGMILEQSKFIKDSDPYWKKCSRLRKFLRYFDLLKPQAIIAAISSGEYVDWYRKILPQLRKEALGDYASPENGYALRRTADFIVRFAREGTLGEDCGAIFLKEGFFGKQ